VTPVRPEALVLDGAAGPLEAVVDDPAPGTVPAAFMVICHPHPLHGGTMNNKVVTTLARCAHLHGAPSIRFNYRGVGKSAGQFDEGRGETDDALGVVAYGRHRWPDAALWLCGFSFGGFVALRASTTRGAGSVARLVTVAPALATHYGSSRDVSVPSCPWLIVQGDADEVVDAKIVVDWSDDFDPRPDLAVLPGVGHFFHGQLVALHDKVMPFLE
jgi:uncharacterized protein